MAMTWTEALDHPSIRDLPPDQIESARQQYFKDVVEPRVPREQLEPARSAFDADTKDLRPTLPPSPEELSRANQLPRLAATPRRGLRVQTAEEAASTQQPTGASALSAFTAQPEKPEAAWLGEGGVVESLPAQFVAGGQNVAARLRQMTAAEGIEQRTPPVQVGFSETPGGAVTGLVRPSARARRDIALERDRAALQAAERDAAVAKKTRELVTPENMTTLQQAASSLAQSAAPTLAGIATGILTRNPYLAMAIAGGGGSVLQGAESYGESMEAGRGHRLSAVAGTIDGILEGVGEALPLAGALRPGTPVFRRIFRTIAEEAGQEAATQIMQDFHAFLTYKPNITLGEAWQNLKVATLAGAGGGAVYGAAGAAVQEPVGKEVGRALDESVRGATVNQAAVDAAARAALSPENAQMQVVPNNQLAGELERVMASKRPVKAELARIEREKAAEEAARAAAIQPLQPAVEPAQPALEAGVQPLIPSAQAAPEPQIPAPSGDGSREAPVVATAPEHVALAGQQVDQNASPAQIEAGVYQKGHMELYGPTAPLRITIETPKGGTRTAADGSWSVPDYPDTYGYVKGTRAKDGEQVDVHVGDDLQAGQVYLIDQINPDGTYDEAKGMLAFPSQGAAVQAYVAGFSDGKGLERIGAITPMSIQQFKMWLDSGNTRKAFRYVQPQKEVPHAAPTGQKQGRDIQKYQRIPQRPNVPEDRGQIREGQGEQAGRGGGVQPSPAPPIPRVERPHAVSREGTLRPLIEQLIKRKAVSREIGRELVLSNAIERAKRAMAGEEITYTAFTRAAKALEKDPVSAKVLRDIAAVIKESKPAVAETPPAPTPVASVQAPQQPAPQAGVTVARPQERSLKAQPAAETPRNDPFLQWVKSVGGISTRYAEGITGEKAFLSNSIVPGLFRKTAQNSGGQIFRGHGLDEIARLAVEAGWLSPAEASDMNDGGVNAITEKLTKHLRGDRTISPVTEDEQFAALRNKASQGFTEAEQEEADDLANEQLDNQPENWSTLTEDEKNVTINDFLQLPPSGVAGEAPAAPAVGPERPAAELSTQTEAELAAKVAREQNQKAADRARIKRESEAAPGAFQLQPEKKPTAIAEAEGAAKQGDIFAGPAQTAATQIAGALRTAADAIDGAGAAKLTRPQPTEIDIEEIKTVRTRAPTMLVFEREDGKYVVEDKSGNELSQPFDSYGEAAAWLATEQAKFDAGVAPGREGGVPEAQQPRSEYNPAQAELIYDHIETRPGTTPEQKALGLSAVLGLFEGDRRVGASMLGSALWKNFIEHAGAELIGQQADSAAQLALLAQILRDPRFETMRVFFVKGDKIVDHVGWTSRMPGSVAFNVEGPTKGGVVVREASETIGRFAGFNGRIEQLKARMRASGADGYFIMHNHPSGTADPSVADRSMTRKVAKAMPGFRGHVVIDHNEYGMINAKGHARVVQLPAPARREAAEPELAHDVLGKVVFRPSHIAEIGRMLTDGRKGYLTLISSTARGEVQALAEFPEALFLGKTKYQQLRAMARVRRFMENTGSAGGAFLVAEKPARFDWMLERGALTDIAPTLSEQAAGKTKTRMESGEVKAGEFMEFGRNSRFVLAANQMTWHGSPYEFEKFSLHKIGTGEGAAAYGWGLYMAGNREVAQFYKKGLSRKALINKARDAYDEFDSPAGALESLLSNPDLNDKEKALMRVLANEDWFGYDYPHQAIQAAFGSTKFRGFDLSPEVQKAVANVGALYQVDLTPAEDEYLLWDKPLSEQSEKVKKVLAEDPIFKAMTGPRKAEFAGQTVDLSEPAGAELYQSLAKKRGKPIGPSLTQQAPGYEAASRYLASIGIPGIKYLDQGSRNVEIKESSKRTADGVLYWLGYRNGELVRQFNTRKEAQAWADSEATYNYVLFDDKLVDIVGVEQPAPTYSVTEAGGPVLEQEGLSITDPKEWDKRGNVTYYDSVVTDGAGNDFGVASLGWTGDQVKELLYLKSFKTRQGVGNRVLGAILAHNDPDTTLHIRYIQPNAREFWEKAGVEIVKTDEGEDGFITKQAFDEARGRRAPEVIGPAQAEVAGDVPTQLEQAAPKYVVKAPLGGAGAIAAALSDVRSTQRTFNLYHRTIGTQPHKAKISPEFGAVYKRVSDYIADSTYIAMEAHAKSQKLLPLIEKVRELGKMPPPTKDLEAVMDALAEGTLAGGGSPLKGQIWADSELRAIKMTDRQIALYHEALDATGVILDELGKSIIYRLQRKDVGLSREAFDNTSLDDIAQVVRDEAENLRDDARLRLDRAQQANDEAGVAKAQAEIDNLEKLLDSRDDKGDWVYGAVTRAERSAFDLKAHGYFPLMRFGRYGVIVKNAKGITVERLHYDFETAANRDFRRLTDLYAKSNPDYKVSRAVLPQKSHQMFQGMSPDAVELFADSIMVPNVDANGVVTMQPLSADAALQAYIKDAVSSRSAMKRNIHRKGIPGFSTDVSRVLSSFIESGGRLAASNYHMADAVEAWSEIPDEKGDVKDEATDLIKFIQDPDAGGSKLGALAFNMFLGGDFGQFVINRTQPVTAGLPWLMQYTSSADAMEKLFSRSPTDQKYRHALQKAKDEGLVAPQELYQLRAYTRARIIAPMLPPQLRQWPQKFATVWGAFMSMSEQSNREQVFKAAWLLANEKPSLGDPIEFAERAIKDTQIEYGRAAIPNWARNPLARPAFVFAQFKITMFEMFFRLARHYPKAAAMMLFILFMLAGIEGEPFAENIEDMIDALGRWGGLNTNSRAKLRELITAGAYGLLNDMTDDETAKMAAGLITEALMRGPLSVSTGIDFSGRFSMGRPIPGTRMLSQGLTVKDVLGMYGPPGAIFANWFEAIQLLREGKTTQAAKMASPRSVQNAAQGTSMWRTGEYRDIKGRKVGEATKTEAIAKMAGLHPENIGRGSRARSIVMDTLDVRRTKQEEIIAEWTSGILDDDQQQIDEARKRWNEWNDKNPEYPITLQMSRKARGIPVAVLKRVQEANLTAEERLIKATPKAARPEVRRQLEGTP